MFSPTALRLGILLLIALVLDLVRGLVRHEGIRRNLPRWVQNDGQGLRGWSVD